MGRHGQPPGHDSLASPDPVYNHKQKGGLKVLYAGFETCFGWGPWHQTTDARVLVGAPGTKPQTHVFWLGPRHQTTGARVLVGAPGTKVAESKTHLESRCCAIFIYNV